jgi:hypothetical protein
VAPTRATKRFLIRATGYRKAMSRLGLGNNLLFFLHGMNRDFHELLWKKPFSCSMLLGWSSIYMVPLMSWSMHLDFLSGYLCLSTGEKIHIYAVF